MLFIHEVETSGGTVHGIFHHYGGGAGTGTCDTGTVYGSANTNDEDTFGCSVGQTLDQMLAPLDLLIIELGTNELNTSSGGNTPLGTPSDAIGVDTVYGAVKNALNTIVTAKPALTVIVVGPAFTSFGTYSTIQANDQAIEYCCNLYSVPYLSMFKQMGMNDVNRMSISDGVHPITSFSQNRYGPMIASFAERFI